LPKTKIFISSVQSPGSVQVMLFADRLEIRNPGNLPPALSIEKLLQDHSSYPFNPLIAEALYLARYIEKMGTGIQDMMQLCSDAGLPAPEFKIEDAFVVTIRRKKASAYEKVGGAISGAIGSATGGANPTERQLEIMGLMKANKVISYREIANILNINGSAVLKQIKSLKRNGIIERIGGTRGYWIIKINDHD